MVSLGTQSAIERAELVTPRLRMRAPRFYPNNLLVREPVKLAMRKRRFPSPRIWRGPGVGNCSGLPYSWVSAYPAK